jgi:hypothetical protein
MSFALEYLSPGGKPPSFEEIESWRLEIPQFEESAERDGVRTWWYRNADTGVYFVVSLYEVRPSEDGSLGPCGLEASVNHLRPTFFAEEAAPILASLAQCLGLGLADGATGMPLLSPAGSPEAFAEIVALWERGNQIAVDEAMEQGKRLHFLDPEAAHRWWEYARRRELLRGQLAQSKIAAEVPEVHFLKAPGTGKVVTAMSWENEGASLFPPSDYVVIDRTVETRRLFRKTSERKVAYLPTEALMRQIVAALRPIESEGMSYRLLTAENAWRAAERIPNLPLEEDMSQFKALRPDQIVDQAP